MPYQFSGLFAIVGVLLGLPPLYFLGGDWAGYTVGIGGFLGLIVFYFVDKRIRKNTPNGEMLDSQGEFPLEGLVDPNQVTDTFKRTATDDALQEKGLVRFQNGKVYSIKKLPMVLWLPVFCMLIGGVIIVSGYSNWYEFDLASSSKFDRAISPYVDVVGNFIPRISNITEQLEFRSQSDRLAMLRNVNAFFWIWGTLSVLVSAFWYRETKLHIGANLRRRILKGRRFTGPKSFTVSMILITLMILSFLVMAIFGTGMFDMALSPLEEKKSQILFSNFELIKEFLLINSSMYLLAIYVPASIGPAWQVLKEKSKDNQINR